MRPRPGLTLLELVVVLAILAVLALTAVLSTDAVVDQGRYDVTAHTLDNVQTAVLGPLSQADADGTRAVTGFVADTGRLPLAWGTDPETQLAELWANPRGLPAFGPVAAPSDPNIQVLAGWRGPYLCLPATVSAAPRLLDGWGNPFAFTADGTALAADAPVVFVRSNGGPAAPYNVPMNVTQPFVPAAVAGTITGAVTDPDPTTPGAQDVTVRLVLPDVTQAGGVRELTATATAANGYTFTFTAVPIGPKALRAYQTYTPTGSMTAVTIKSDILHLRVPPGGLTRNVALDLH